MQENSTSEEENEVQKLPTPIDQLIDNNIRESQELRVKLKDIKSTIVDEIQNEFARQMVDMNDPV